MSPFVFLTSSIVIDDSEHDPVVFNARLKEFIDDRTANPGTYVAGVRDSFTFVRDALRYALLESRYDPGKPTATEEYYQSTNYWPAKCPLNLFRSGSLPVGPSKLDARAFIKLVN